MTMKKGEMSAGLKAARGRTLSFVGPQGEEEPGVGKGADVVSAENGPEKAEPAAVRTDQKMATAKGTEKASPRAAKPARIVQPTKTEQRQEPSPGTEGSAGAEVNKQSPPVVFGRAPWPLVYFDEPELEPPPPGYETAHTVVNFRLPTTMDKGIDQHVAMLDTNKSEWIRRACMHQMALERAILAAKMAGKG